MASVQNNMNEELRETPEESYHKKLGKMIKKVKTETKWRDIFKMFQEHIILKMIKYLVRGYFTISDFDS